MAEAKRIEGQATGKGIRATVIVSRWNEFVTKDLLDGALDELRKTGCTSVEVIHVPGTWEMPPATAAVLTRAEGKPDVVIAVGCVIMGQTAHGRLLSGDVSSALMRLQVEHKTPIGWAVLTPDSSEQAIDRAGMKMGNKGREAVLAALELADVLRQLS